MKKRLRPSNKKQMFYLSLTILFSLIAAPFAGVFAQDPSFDLLIKDARIVDGTGNPWFRGDIAIRAGRIASVGRLTGVKAARTIDAKGLIAAPGFIDVHTHVEDVYKNPKAENFIRMGVTSLITGNCGGSDLDIAAFLGKSTSTPIAVNVGTLIGHNTVRSKAMGLDDRIPTAQEQAAMEAFVDKAMLDGALGFSTGLEYLPGMFSKTDEIVGMAKVAAQHGGVYATHMRNEGMDVKKSIAESLVIGEQAKIPVDISHFKISDKNGWGQSNETLGMVRAARDKGMTVTVDQYAYTASSTSLDVRLPNWAVAGGRDQGRKRIADPEIRKRIVQEMKQNLKDKGFSDYSFAYVATYSSNPQFNGKNIAEITKLARGNSAVDDQIDQILEMYTKGGAQMVYRTMDEGDVKNIMREPFTMIASDSSVREFNVGNPHPRGYGNNARVLGQYVREQKLITLEDAVRKMTSLPAQTFNLRDRGLIREGYAADIVLFDEKLVTDKATFDAPHQYANGFSSVIVNGEVVLDGNSMTGKMPGKPLYGPGRAQRISQ
jgi:N-acyl-D-amino-acid deacylase